MGELYWSIAPLPSPDGVEALGRELDRAFPHEENRAYLEALRGGRVLSRVAAARLGALALLPSLLRRGGVDPAEVILRRDAQGRPYVVDRTGGAVAVDFNLSHSEDFGLCALLTGGGRVGVDREEDIPPRRALPLIRRYCTEGERRLLEPLSEAERALAFTRIWTIREALGKQEGRGMPLSYDAAAIPSEVRVLTGRGAGGFLALCAPRGAFTGAPVAVTVDGCFSVEWTEHGMI